MTTSNQIKYRKGYKYQLAEDYTAAIGICPEQDIVTHFIELTKEGQLTVRKDYAWDGPSGPTVDTKSFMRGSLEHDALYQLIREGWLTQEHRAPADARLKKVCEEDGMFGLRSAWVFAGVRAFGNPATIKREDEVITAP